MRPHNVVVAASMLAGVALGKAFTTIDPCPSAPANITQLHASITVTAQHQPVSTCAPSGTTFTWNTYDWVSTVIPCWGQSSGSSCTVTNTEQIVPCTGTATTITSIIPTRTALPNGTYKSYDSTLYETVSKLWVAPYNELGPLAIPGYDGCGLCDDCGVQADGSRNQKYSVTECTSIVGKQPVCSDYPETWVSLDAPSTTGAATATISQHTAIPSAGVYTFSFAQPAPVTSISSNGGWYNVPAQPWTANVVQSFNGPTTYDIVTIITKTVTYTVPYTTAGASDQGWGAWQPAQTASPTQDPSNNGKPSWSTDQGWGAWQPAQTASPTQDPSNDGKPSWSTTQPGGNSYNNGGWGGWSTSTRSTQTSTTSAQTSTTSTQTSTTSSQTTDLPVETSFFYIAVTYSGLKRRYTKRGDLTYVGFPSGDDAAVVGADQNPSRFAFDVAGYLRVGDEYIIGDSSSGYFVFEKSNDKPAQPPSYELGPNGEFVRTDSGGFCATSSSFFITLTSSPSDCKKVSCNAADNLSQTSSTTSSTTTSSTTTSSTTQTTTTPTTTTPTTTATQPDISADLDVPEPTRYVRRSDRRY